MCMLAHMWVFYNVRHYVKSDCKSHISSKNPYALLDISLQTTIRLHVDINNVSQCIIIDTRFYKRMCLRGKSCAQSCMEYVSSACGAGG